jgi:acetyl esterase/lipase
MRIIGTVLALLLAAWTSLLYIPFRWRPYGMFLFAPKIAAGSLANVISFVSLLLATFGLVKRSALITALAGATSIGAARAVSRVSTAQVDLDRALGPDWRSRIPPEQRARMLSRRWNWRIPDVPEPRWQRDVPFCTVPDTNRTLLCDIWQPPAGVKASGLAFIYLYGSAWYILDKDLGTRPLFRHLAAQGHVVMDVAYRLYPETDIPGMVGDVKRAVAWLKQHAAEYNVRPDRIVLGGGSAGAHLALLAGYASRHSDLTPSELADADLNVRGVVSLYGQADLAAHYFHTDQQLSTKPDDPKPDWDAPPPPWMVSVFGTDAGRLGLQKMMVAGRCDWLVGGTPDEVPERYATQSPISHVHSECPPTLLIHGTHDMMAPFTSMQNLYQKLLDAGVPVAFLALPHTDHAFDMLFWEWSPPAQAAFYEMERFLAVLAASDREDLTNEPGN